MYKRETDINYDKRRSRRRRRRRRRRQRPTGLLLMAALLLVVGGLLAFRAKEDRAEEGGKASQVSAALPTPQAASKNEAEGDEIVPPEEAAVVPEEPSYEPPQSSADTQDPETPSLPVSPEEPVEGGEPVLPPDGDDWHLVLVNPWNFMPEGYEVTLKSLGGGHKVDERCYDDLQAMLAACEEEGLSPIICSSYRTQEKQESLFQNKIQRLINQGYSEEEAPVEAAKVVAVPGTSEHQLGLALDIVDISNQVLDKSQEGTPVQQWLMAHSWEYGFILRYPNEKSEITGIIYEPWHYRYVGKEFAKEIYEQEVCLEEYLGRVEG